MNKTPAERWRKWRATHHRPKPRRKRSQTAQAAYSRASYERKRARGECARCSSPAIPGHVLCQFHRDASKLVSETTRRDMYKGRYTSPRWEEVEATMWGACERCGLRGKHECLPARADGEARRGPGRVYPGIEDSQTTQARKPKKLTRTA